MLLGWCASTKCFWKTLIQNVSSIPYTKSSIFQAKCYRRRKKNIPSNSGCQISNIIFLKSVLLIVMNKWDKWAFCMSKGSQQGEGWLSTNHKCFLFICFARCFWVTCPSLPNTCSEGVYRYLFGVQSYILRRRSDVYGWFMEPQRPRDFPL